MTDQLFPRQPRRLKQPTKDLLRQHLASITEENIRLRAEVENHATTFTGACNSHIEVIVRQGSLEHRMTPTITPEALEAGQPTAVVVWHSRAEPRGMGLRPRSPRRPPAGGGAGGFRAGASLHRPAVGRPMVYADSREIFADLWDSTGGDWSANPWVWVISFRRIDDGGK